MNLTQRRFLGFQNTPFLWSAKLFGLKQCQIEKDDVIVSKKIDDTIRLGNYVERLVSYKLSEIPEVSVLKENAQIINNKITLGEIDCLLLHNNQPIHVEIAYKFYLYDPNVGSSFLEHWIGPNKRDSLLLKLNKIQQKQFPLLYSEHCKTLLDQLNLDIKQIEQQTYFKAQLYIPYKSEPNFTELNKDSVYGFYINAQELELFKDCKFYIPRKLDWLIEPHAMVEWMNYETGKERIKEFHQKQSAPLCWVKQSNGEIQKAFVVWW